VREPFLQHRRTPAHLSQVSRVRSTLVSSSLHAVKKHGLWERYDAALPALHRDAIASCVAGSWMSLAVATAHYEAMDALGLDAASVAAFGADVSRQTQHTFLSTMTRLATTSGATPWSALGQFQRLWDRIFDGGDIAVWKTGPKDAVVEATGCPLFRVRYFRSGYAHYVRVLCELFATRVFAREITRQATSDSAALQIMWA